jgi:hypothetical protein
MTVDDAQEMQDRSREQPYSSFLIRCWGLSDGKRRIKVQHIQSGKWTPTATLAEALDWLEARFEEQVTPR